MGAFCEWASSRRRVRVVDWPVPWQVHAHERRLAAQQRRLAALDAEVCDLNARLAVARRDVGGDRSPAVRLAALDAARTASGARHAKLLEHRNSACAVLRRLRQQVDGLRHERVAYEAALRCVATDVGARAASLQRVLCTAATAHAARDAAHAEVDACAAAAEAEQAAFEAACADLNARIAANRRAAREATRDADIAAAQAAAMAAAVAGDKGTDGEAHGGGNGGQAPKPGAQARQQVSHVCALVDLPHGTIGELLAAFASSEDASMRLMAQAEALTTDLTACDAACSSLEAQVEARRASGRALYAQRRDAVRAAEGHRAVAVQRLHRMAARREAADACVDALQRGVLALGAALGAHTHAAAAHQPGGGEAALGCDGGRLRHDHVAAIEAAISRACDAVAAQTHAASSPATQTPLPQGLHVARIPSLAAPVCMAGAGDGRALHVSPVTVGDLDDDLDDTRPLTRAELQARATGRNCSRTECHGRVILLRSVHPLLPALHRD